MFSLKENFPYTPMNHQTEDDNPEFDTLSLSDLPIYTHSSSDSSLTNSSSILDQPNNDSFEFMKMDFRLQSHPDIVFCGKPIPCKEAPTYQNNRYTSKLGHSRHKKCMPYFFGTRSSASSKSDNKVNQIKVNSSGSEENSNKNGSSKFKWCFLVFGLQRFSVPKKMELNDIKYRQSRKGAKSVEMLERSNSIDASIGKLDRSLSYLLRSLSCKSNHSINVLD